MLDLLWQLLLAWLWAATFAPLAFQFSVGCCCDTCTIASDSFTRADDTDINTGSSAGWSEDSGTWAITSNQLVSTAAGLVTCTTAHPDGDTTMAVQATFKHGTSTSSCYIRVCIVDSSNYFYVRFRIGSNTVEIRKVVAGVDSLIASASFTLNTNTTYTGFVCVSESGTIMAMVDGTAVVATLPGQAVSGTSCGLGANGSGTATFDNFVFTKRLHSTNATECVACTACTHCTSAPRDQYQIDITGVGAGAGPCASCSSWNSTYIVDYDPAFDYVLFPSSDKFCFWTVAKSLCSATKLILGFSTGGVSYVTDNGIDGAANKPSIFFSSAVGGSGGGNCGMPTPLVITGSYGSAAIQCASASFSCTVTRL